MPVTRFDSISGWFGADPGGYSLVPHCRIEPTLPDGRRFSGGGPDEEILQPL